MQLLRLGALAAVAAAVAIVPAAPAVAAAPVLVKQCFVTSPRPLSKNAGGTQIDYVIYGKKKASAITFAVAYRNAAQHFLRTVTDYGTFSPGVEIKHHFSLFNDVTYAGQHVQSCVPTRVKWADSTMWMTPTH
jgi:hypothetical protein